MNAIPVYLIHWNAPEWLVSTIASVASTVGRDIDIVVIDNGNSGGDRLASLSSGVRIIGVPRNAGFTGGANVALRDWLFSPDAAPYAVIGSHDLRVEPSTISSLADDLDAHPDIGIIGPAIQLGCYQGPTTTMFASLPEGAGILDGNWISGSCMLIRRECALSVGDFDETFGSYMEDVDYGLRAVDTGWRVCVDSDAPAYGLGSAARRTAYRMIAYNSIRLARKRFGIRGALRAVAFRVEIGLRRVAASFDFRRERDERASARTEGVEYLKAALAGIGLVIADRSADQPPPSELTHPHGQETSMADDERSS
jgi:GT2 family glycosyltransferase